MPYLVLLWGDHFVLRCRPASYLFGSFPTLQPFHISSKHAVFFVSWGGCERFSVLTIRHSSKCTVSAVDRVEYIPHILKDRLPLSRLLCFLGPVWSHQSAHKKQAVVGMFSKCIFQVRKIRFGTIEPTQETGDFVYF